MVWYPAHPPFFLLFFLQNLLARKGLFFALLQWLWVLSPSAFCCGRHLSHPKHLLASFHINILHETLHSGYSALTDKEISITATSTCTAYTGQICSVITMQQTHENLRPLFAKFFVLTSLTLITPSTPVVSIYRSLNSNCPTLHSSLPYSERWIRHVSTTTIATLVHFLSLNAEKVLPVASILYIQKKRR